MLSYFLSSLCLFTPFKKHPTLLKMSRVGCFAIHQMIFSSFDRFLKLNNRIPLKQKNNSMLNGKISFV